MKAKDYRKYFANSKKDTDKLRDLDFIGCYQKDSNQEIIKKGFFELYHGEKESESGFIKSAIEIAEDGQAIYEFLQNAVDANARDFFIFYNQKYFLVINNGKKFKEDDIKSILNVSQSTKENSSSTIGKFGIGFKLVHRLVGENSGLEEIKRYSGPVLFSWDNNYLDNFLKNELTDIDNHWLFKILYTNFPCGVGETVKGVTYEEITPFSQNELDGMISFIQTSLSSSGVDFKDLKEGSLFFLELGKGKNGLLENEEKSIKNGISYSINIIQEVQKNAKLNRVIINDTCVECDKNMAVISGESYIFMYPKFIEKALTFSRKPEKEKTSFFKYFPMGSQNNNLNFMLHSEKFDIQANRRELHETPINSELLNKIANNLIIKFEQIKNEDEECYRTILVNLYLSDLETAGNAPFIKTHLTNHLLAYIKKNIPTADSGFDIDASKVKIIRSELDVKLKKNNKFFNFKNADVIREAKSKLGLQEWNIIDALRNDDIEDWVKTLSSDDYLTFFNEINSAKNLNNESIKAISDKKIFSFSNGDFKSANEIDKSSKFFYKGSFGSQAEDILSNKFDFNFTIVNLLKYPELFHFLKKPKINSTYFIGEYSYDDVHVILSIFKSFKIKDFAIRQKDDKYIIDAKSKHIHIENKAFKDFLETHDSDVLGNLALIPEPFEKTVLSFLELSPFDEEIKKKLIDSKKHQELIDFIVDDKKELREYFLNSLTRLDLFNEQYQKEDYEHKVISLILDNDDAFIKEFRTKIYVDGKRIGNSLISDSVNFKYGKIALKKINYRKYKNHQNVDVGNILRSFSTSDVGKLEKLIFNFQEENKDALYSEIYVYLRNGERKIGDEEKLKFIVFYSLEKNENLLKKDFKNGFLFWDRKNEKDDQERSCKIVGDLFNKLSDYSEAVLLFKAVDFFPKYLNQECYLLDSDVAIEQEKLPEFFQKEDNNNYLKTYRKFGLNLDEMLPTIRRKIISHEELKRDDLAEFSHEKIISTIEFLSKRNDVYTIDEQDISFRNLKRLFERLDLDEGGFHYFSFLPVLLSNSTFQIRECSWDFYITAKQLACKNKHFQSRLLKDIESKNIIYLDIFDLNFVPSELELVDESDKEKQEFTNSFIASENESIHAQLSKSNDYSEDNALIGRKGELYVYKVLSDKYGAKNVTWNNSDVESKGIDIELRIKDKIHFIEVKTTTESVNIGNDLRFFMSSNQFNAATSWGRDTHLIFVVGINDTEPKLLYFNFNNEWLDSF